MKPRKQFKKAKRKNHKVGANATGSERESTSDSDSELTLHMVSAVVKDTEPLRAFKKENAMSSLMMIRPKVEGHLTDMKPDTGAAVSPISVEMYKTKFAHKRLRKTNVVLKTYTGEVLLPEGMVKVWVKINKEKVRLPLYVVSPTLWPRMAKEHKA